MAALVSGFTPRIAPLAPISESKYRSEKTFLLKARSLSFLRSSRSGSVFCRRLRMKGFSSSADVGDLGSGATEGGVEEEGAPPAAREGLGATCIVFSPPFEGHRSRGAFEFTARTFAVIFHALRRLLKVVPLENLQTLDHRLTHITDAAPPNKTERRVACSEAKCGFIFFVQSIAATCDFHFCSIFWLDFFFYFSVLALSILSCQSPAFFVPPTGYIPLTARKAPVAR